MSVQAMTWAWAQTVVTDPLAVSVLLAYANFATPNGEDCFPSTEVIVQMTKLSERTVRKKVDDLIIAGVMEVGDQEIVRVKIAHAGRRPVNYRLRMDVLTPDDVPPADSIPGVQLVHETTGRGAARVGQGCSSGSLGVQLTSFRGAPAAPKPIYNPNKPSKTPNPLQSPAASEATSMTFREQDDDGKIRTVSLDLPSWLPTEAWGGYLQTRKAKKAPRTVRAIQGVLRKLEAFRTAGHDVEAILDTSTERGWTGVFEPKGGFPPSAAPRRQSFGRSLEQHFASPEFDGR
ncbi:helix-turn-helix domain-containing protein [Gluconobacter oxydans]|uniref:helix-turn-helix domain-containing protein n=1 Tax=Gluconobacter oxydans TaxID=442 RepID=UPI001CD861BD|nr:helix-turn-helix domain-containing protein [Gluconobacter oxydans]